MDGQRYPSFHPSKEVSEASVNHVGVHIGEGFPSL